MAQRLESKFLMRTLIAEDEPLALNKLKIYLQDFEWINIIHESTNGEDAFNNIENKKPELVIIDIEMPKLSGIDVIASLSYHPNVIFITAYNSYAIKAFELHAIEYILKPYSRKRLSQALCHQQLKHAQLPNNLNSHFVYNENNSIKSIAIKEIIYIQAQGNYSLCVSLNKKALISKRLNELVLPDQFFRCHHSYYCNITLIEKIEPYNSSYRIMTQLKKEIPVSRRKYSDLILKVKNQTHPFRD